MTQFLMLTRMGSRRTATEAVARYPHRLLCILYLGVFASLREVFQRLCVTTRCGRDEALRVVGVRLLFCRFPSVDGDRIPIRIKNDGHLATREIHRLDDKLASGFFQLSDRRVEIFYLEGD
jgi:hypothetical protein